MAKPRPCSFLQIFLQLSMFWKIIQTVALLFIRANVIISSLSTNLLDRLLSFWTAEGFELGSKNLGISVKICKAVQTYIIIASAKIFRLICYSESASSDFDFQLVYFLNTSSVCGAWWQEENIPPYLAYHEILLGLHLLCKMLARMLMAQYFRPIVVSHAVRNHWKDKPNKSRSWVNNAICYDSVLKRFLQTLKNSS